jgi:hypothetical protein
MVSVLIISATLRNLEQLEYGRKSLTHRRHRHRPRHQHHRALQVRSSFARSHHRQNLLGRHHSRLGSLRSAHPT